MRVLHLEDSPPDAELVAARLGADWPDCRIEHASSREQFESALERGNYDLILSDYTLHGYDGLSALVEPGPVERRAALDVERLRTDDPAVDLALDAKE